MVLLSKFLFNQVRFRVGHELQDLSKGTQSGGEKSVTTAVYMMALQELTQVPFRCVDEINQGKNINLTKHAHTNGCAQVWMSVMRELSGPSY